ncbi:30S ribosomal protein S2 [Patescibacteria group bacterium]|nr:30S ribosomal protein S2 [Patescibacteria group bacterium]MCH8889432.1 30S ribosomal protein S2 [Patescibacteria group bacterium]
MEEVTITKNNPLIDDMFKAGAHFGYSKSKRHPSMARYIFGVKNRVEIFDLEKTSDLLLSTLEFMKECGKNRKTVLFVGGKNEARDVIRNAATEISMPYVAGRWIGGTLTNFSEIKKRITRLQDLTEQRHKGDLDKYTKLERLMIDREIEDLEKTFGGIRHMNSLPHVLFVVDTKYESIAVKEAKKVGIPVVGLLNTDCNTIDADYFVAGNDVAQASIFFFVGELVKAYKEGLSQAPEDQPNQPKSDEPQAQKKETPKESTDK